ncbi:unnamed protein product [Symbiodinium microadriaticum]|nr:unnamed protein product [Symbiodinium microadriaticum]
MAQRTKLPLSVTNLDTGLPNESQWENLGGMSPKNFFPSMKKRDDVTSFLYFNNFQFELQKSPQKSDFQLKGIEVNLLRKGVNVMDFWVDMVYPSKSDEMSLTKNNKATENIWPFIYTDVSYGGEQELWGRSWTTDEINSEQFGVVVAAQAMDNSAMADIKRIEIVVHYEELKLHFSARDWQDTTNGLTDDSLYAFSTFDSTATITKYLYSSDYGFSIPVDANITGFTASVQKRASGTAQDHFVGLAYPDGTAVSITFPGKQDGTNWTTGEGTSNYGNSNDPWNKVWTPSEINDENFGFVISAMGNEGDSPLIDLCSITVHYNRIYSEIASGGVASGGSGENSMTMNETASGGGVVSRLSTYDIDGEGGAVLAGAAINTMVMNADINTNQVTFISEGSQVNPPSETTTQIVHASVSWDSNTNVVSWFVNNTDIPNANIMTLRQGEVGEGGPLRINVKNVSDTTNPHVGSQVVDASWITEIENGEWYLVVRDTTAAPDIWTRGQVVQTGAALGGGAVVTSMSMNETPTGGVVMGSRAFFIFSDDSTGGVEIGGDGTLGKLVMEDGTGGAVVGGQETNFKDVIIDGSGGIEAAGVSDTQAVYEAIATGAALAGGKIIQGIHPYIAPAGVEAAGVAQPLNILNVSTSGGAVVAGAIRINMYWLHNPVEDGGVVMGGKAFKERIRQLTSATISGIGS